MLQHSYSCFVELTELNRHKYTALPGNSFKRPTIQWLKIHERRQSCWRGMCVQMYVAWHVHCSIQSSLSLAHTRRSLILYGVFPNLSFVLTCLIKALVTPSNQSRFVISCSRRFSISCQQYDNESFPWPSPSWILLWPRIDCWRHHTFDCSCLYLMRFFSCFFSKPLFV